MALEDLERATMRMVCEAIYLQLNIIAEEFQKAGSGFVDGVNELAVNPEGETVSDRYDYLGEDLTRFSLDSIGLSRVPAARLVGAIDYKLAHFMFMPNFAVKQALFVDSKAEKGSLNNCRVQTTQTSLTIRQRLSTNAEIGVPGLVEKIWTTASHAFITTTIFVKYHYDTSPYPNLKQMTIAALPHGFLQDVYNPNCDDNIWNIGPNSPARNEKFRTRLNFKKLEKVTSWRVQRIKPNEIWKFKE